MRCKKGQGTVEFIILFSSALFFFVIFMGIIQMNIADTNLEKQRIFLQNIALNVKNEIAFVAESKDGYTREFYVPQNSLGIDYEINLTDGYVFCFMTDYSISYRVFNVTGQIQKGDNLIRKENGEVYLNS
jgi:hypothetical protein